MRCVVPALLASLLFLLPAGYIVSILLAIGIILHALMPIGLVAAIYVVALHGQG